MKSKPAQTHSGPQAKQNLEPSKKIKKKTIFKESLEKESLFIYLFICIK